MGRQINFYFTAVDERNILDAIEESGKLYVVRSVARKSAHEVRLPLRPMTSNSNPYLSSLILSPIDICPKIISEHNPERQEYYIDKADSEAVSYRRCVLSRDNKSPSSHLRISGGRFWYSPVDLKRKPKRPEFCRWANRVLALVRRRSQRLNDVMYIGPDAARMVREGSLLLGNM